MLWRAKARGRGFGSDAWQPPWMMLPSTIVPAGHGAAAADRPRPCDRLVSVRPRLPFATWSRRGRFSLEDYQRAGPILTMGRRPTAVLYGVTAARTEP
jgi:hypothetical protein